MDAKLRFFGYNVGGPWSACSLLPFANSAAELTVGSKSISPTKIGNKATEKMVKLHITAAPQIEETEGVTEIALQFIYSVRMTSWL